jgi:hypothetical protein
MKLLVVEDEALLRHHLFNRLSEQGHVVDAALPCRSGFSREAVAANRVPGGASRCASTARTSPAATDPYKRDQLAHSAASGARKALL